jgi:EmrB/QacA subfamily drug resistance transporter
LDADSPAASPKAHTTPAPSPAPLLIAVALSAGLAPLNSTMLVVAIPRISAAFGHGISLTTHALVTSYLVGSIVLQSPGGKLGDVVGYRRAFSLGQATFFVGALLATLAPSLALLTLARVVMSIGGAIIVPSATALLRTEVPLERRGRAFGAFGATMALSAAVGPIVGGQLADAFGYRALFLANVPVLVVAALLARGSGSRDASRVPTKLTFDFVGMALLTLGLGAIVVGSKLVGTTRLALLAGGAVLLAAFVVWERRVEDPIVDLSLLTRRVYVAGGMIVALHNLGMYALMFAVSSALATMFSLTPRQTGQTIIVMMVAMVIASPISGRLIEKLGARVVALAGCVSALLGLVYLRFITIDAPLDVAPGLFALGFGLGLAASPAQSSAMSASPREQSGMAAGLLAMLRYLGGVVGLLVIAFVVDEGAEGPAIVRELRSAIDYFMVAMVAAIPFAMVLPARLPKPDEAAAVS